MKLESIRNKVTKIVSDKGYDPITVDGFINQSLNFCLEVVDVPDFKSVFTVSTSTSAAFVNLKDEIPNYGGRLKRVKYDGADLTIRASLEDLLDDFDDLETEGDIEQVALEGRNLWYAKIPETSVDLLVLCYTNPEPLSKSNEEITWMPDSCQVKILVHGACHFIFNEIEEEDSGYLLASRYKKELDDGILDFKAWLSKRRQSLTHSHWSY